MLLHTNTLIRPHSGFYIKALLRRGWMACKYFYTEVLWHTVTDDFTHKYFYTVMFFAHRLRFLNTHTHMHTRMVFHRDVFKRTCFTQIVFSKLRCFYTEMLSHRGAYTYGNVFTHKYFYTEMILHWGTLNTHTHTNAITKAQFHHSFERARRISC